MRNFHAVLATAGLALLSGLPVAASDAGARPPGGEGREHFAIKAQPLATALREYAQQTGEQVVFFSEVGRGRESSDVSGQFTRDAALRKMLESTGLTYTRLNARTVAIGVADSPTMGQPLPGASSSTLRLAPVETPLMLAMVDQDQPAGQGSTAAQAPPPEPSADEELFAMGQVVVTGTASRERTKYESSVAISTFDDEDIEQLSPDSTADLISAVPGFWVESTAGTTQGNVFARGIIQDGGYRYVGLMEDGIPVYPVFELSFYNPDQFVRVDEMVTRVEALRGGTAPIFTSGAVGGSINFVTLAPGEEPAGTAKATIADYGLYRADLAWSGPVSDTWGLAVGGYYRRSDGIRDPGYTADEGGQLRFNIVGELEGSRLEIFGKYIDDRSLFVVPLPLRGDPSDPDTLDADPGDYSLHSEDLARAGLPPSAAEVGLRGSDLEDGIHPQLATLGGRWTWDFSEQASFTNALRFTDGEVRFDGIFPGDPPASGADFAAGRGVAPVYTVIRTGEAYDPANFVQNHGHWVVNKEYEAFQDDMRVNFTLQSHDLAVGLYLADYSMSDRWSLGNLLLMDVSSEPNRLSLAGVTDPDGFTQYSFFNLAADYDARQYALYASDEWQVTEQLRLDFGIRYDNPEVDASISNGTTADLDGNPLTPWDNTTALAGTARTDSSRDFSHTSYSAGFNYEFIDRHAMFGHYTESAKLPHFDDIRGGSLLDDEVTNIELGYKTSLGYLALFATLFQTEFDNVFFNDILADGSTARRFAATRTRGIELEGIVQPYEAFAVDFSITLQEPEYRDFVVRNAQTGTVTDLSGNQIRRIPETMARITPTFYFAGGRGRAYFTYSHFGERFSNDENTIELPSYDKFDAGVIFDVTDALTVQIFGDNLTDEVGLTEGNPRTDVGAGGLGVLYNARPLFGRSVQASATMRF